MLLVLRRAQASVGTQFKKSAMNTFHQEPRFDCKNMARCGIHSLSKCRKYKGTLPECVGCTLVKRKAKTRHFVEPSHKLCPHCGRVLKVFMFYSRTTVRSGKEYQYRTSWCKQCMCHAANIRNRKKVISQFV